MNAAAEADKQPRKHLTPKQREWIIAWMKLFDSEPDGGSMLTVKEWLAKFAAEVATKKAFEGVQMSHQKMYKLLEENDIVYMKERMSPSMHDTNDLKNDRSTDGLRAEVVRLRKELKAAMEMVLRHEEMYKELVMPTKR